MRTYVNTDPARSLTAVTRRLYRLAIRPLQILAVIAAVGLTATFSYHPKTLERIQRIGTLVLATTNSPTTYYLGAYGPAGPDYELAQGLAAELGVRLRVRLYSTGRQALEAVAANQADIAAPGVSVEPRDYPRLLFTPPYQMVSRLVIYRRGEAVPADLTSLASPEFPLTVTTGYAPLMRRLAARYPGLKWRARSGAGTDELLVDLAAGKIAYTIANDNEFNLNRRFYPALNTAFVLGKPHPIAWAVRGGADSTLYQATTAYFARAQASHRIANIMQRYYGRLEAYDPVSTQLFLHNLGNRLPRYAASFESAATATGLSWQLLVAMGYQESHWNPKARSPTGVRGLMMLTRSTATQLGIHDRLNPHLSIIGGARYLSMLLKRLPASITNFNRLWMALAAYNMGYGHLIDARRLVRRLGGNPDNWAAIRKVLPLLNERRYYRRTRFGYVNGIQAVQYVTRIQTYYAVLMWRTAQNSLPTEVTDRLVSASATTPVIY